MVKNRKNGRDNVKVVPELGANAKGEQQGGIPVEMTDPFTSQTVDVRGTNIAHLEDLFVRFRCVIFVCGCIDVQLHAIHSQA